MKRFVYWILAAAFVGTLALSCARKSEEEAPEVRPAGKYSSIEAYIVNLQDADATRTDYTIDEDNKVAVFSWTDGDHIDATVSKGDVISSVVFTKQPDDQQYTNRFLDGQLDGEATLEERVGYALSGLAFYPSRVSPEALEGGFIADWSYEGGAYTLDLPASITRPNAKPLSAIPMVGKCDAEGKYAFTQPVGVLAVPVTGLPLEADFISIHSETVALAGAFTLTETPGGAYIAARNAVADVEKTLTQHFSGLEGDHTFYFSVPVGTLPAGVVLTVGSSSDPDIRMTRVTTKEMVISRANIVRTYALAFEPVSQQWEDFATASFLDDFMWAQHGWSTSTWIPVTIQRSGLHPEKYRIANPYSKACTAFGYTPYTAGVVSDDYFVYYIQDGIVSYTTFRTGVEDKNSGGRPMMITYSKVWSSTKNGNETKIVSQLTDGTILELQFGAIYSQYENQSAYMYTRDGEGNASTQRIHLVIDDDTPETWSSIGECTFIDHFIWPYEELTDPVVREIQQFSHNANRFRIAKPYPADDADEWFIFDVSNPNAVTSVNYYTGTTVADETYPEVTWKAVVWNGAYQYNYSNVISTQSNGLPLEVQIGPCYRDVKYSTESWDYDYSREVGCDNAASAPNIDIIFPHPEETWTSLGTGRYMDEWFWSNNSFAPYNVEVEIWRSDLDPNRYRVANPYTVANTAFKRPAIAGADEYLFLSVDPSTSLVTYETLKTGMDRSGSANRNLAAAHPATWNSMKGTSLDVSTTKVVSGTAASPLEIQLAGVYYDSADNTHFYTNNTGMKHLWFPGWDAGETWSHLCYGTYKDNIYDTKINGSSTLGTVEVSIQQSSINPKRYRIANPYKGLDSSLKQGTPDDWLYFQYNNGLVYNELLETGVQMDNSSRILMISHPVDANISGYYGTSSDFSGSSVLTWDSDGAPKKIQLGAYWYDKNTPTTNYCYTRGGTSWSEDTRIVITFNTADKAAVTAYEYPLKPNFHNPVSSLVLPNGTLERLVVKISGDDLSVVTGVRLWQDSQGGWMNSDYVAPDADGVVTMDSFSNAAVSGNIDMNFWATEVMGHSYRFDVQEVVVSGVSLPVVQDEEYPHLGGIVLNTGGDKISVRGFGGVAEETVNSFRIPALVTSKAGTLIAAYDVRYDSNRDLVADIDVGLKRSTDGGKTWSAIQLIMDMGTYGYDVTDQDSWKNAQKQNGIGDPCLLVDEETGRIFCFATWAHGHLNDADNRSLAYAGKGFEIEDTPQFMMVYSDDDGLTWSEPINLTRQIKKQDWRMTFQGPGRGITMADGTLVIPMQHQEGESKIMHSLYPLNSGIAYSTDHGETWHMHNYAYPVTSECAVAEIAPGKLLLTMRDETDSHYRREYVTTDLGRTWTPFEHNGMMWDSTTEASILKVDAAHNSLHQDLLIFSSPQDCVGWRDHMTIQVSLDMGLTWPYKLLVDAGSSLGYSCLSMVDESTVGILYESSRGNIFFQAVPLTDIVK